MAIKCSPMYPEGRHNGSTECLESCIYWKKCLEELKLPEKFKLVKWVRVKPNARQIKNGEFLILNKLGVAYKYVWKKIKKGKEVKENIFEK